MINIANYISSLNYEYSNTTMISKTYYLKMAKAIKSTRNGINQNTYIPK